MFEKEAEEYQTEKRKTFNEYEQLCWGDVYKDWKKGAEFGFYKANVWHYVKDELPESLTGSHMVNVKAVYLNSFKNPVIFPCCYDGEDFVYLNENDEWKKVNKFKGEVYAWKYDVNLYIPEPPKEIE